MPRYFLELSYRGTNYSGWQIQQNAVSVQEKVNAAISLITQKQTETTGCGRTDTGVHSTQFFAHFDVDNQIIDAFSFVYQVNGILPFDISIKALHPVDDAAHARFDAVKRTYRYYVHTYKNGFLADFSGCYFKKVNINLLNEACLLLKAHTDFAAFCKANAQNKTNVCHIHEAGWAENEGVYCFEISADRFLRGMVRALVGTMIDVASEKTTLNQFEEIILSKDRRNAGAAAPACGLYLTKVDYPYLKVSNNFEFPVGGLAKKQGLLL